MSCYSGNASKVGFRLYKPIFFYYKRQGAQRSCKSSKQSDLGSTSDAQEQLLFIEQMIETKCFDEENKKQQMQRE